MVAPPIVIGLERLWGEVSNADGGKVSLFYTVLDAAENFSARAEQTGNGTAILNLYRANGNLLRQWLIAPGSQALITLQDSITINVPFSIVRTRVTLQGAPA